MCDSSCGSERTYADQVRMPIKGRVRSIDKCIHSIVAALNAANIPTEASCCGHKETIGQIALEDGRVLGIFSRQDNQVSNLHDWEIANEAIVENDDKLLMFLPLLERVPWEYFIEHLAEDDLTEERMACVEIKEILDVHQKDGKKTLSVMESLESLMKTFTAQISPEVDELLDQLVKELGVGSRAHVFRVGIGLLKLAVEAQREDKTISITDKDGNIVKGITLPSEG